jgi:hypothetical protein
MSGATYNGAKDVERGSMNMHIGRSVIRLRPAPQAESM